MTKKLKIVLITSVLAGSFSCAYAGWFSPKSNFEKAKEALAKANYVNAVEFYSEACNEGHFESCNEAGSYYEGGMGIQKDNYKAKIFYEKACNGGYAYGCSNLQSIDKQEMKIKEQVEAGRKKRETDSKKFNEAKTNCDAGSTDWCGAVGFHYYHGLGIDKNLDLAEKYLQRSCDAGHNKWCGWLGELSYGKKDYFKTFESYSKACDAGGAVECRSVGYLYENGQGTRLDIAKAADFYGKACDMKDQAGCENYKRLKSPQPIQQASNNNSNSDFQKQQLEIQRKQLQAQEEQTRAARRAAEAAEDAQSYQRARNLSGGWLR